MVLKKISQNTDILARIDGNVFPWQPSIIKNKSFFTNLHFKYQPPNFICSPIMLAPVISSLDEIYCTISKNDAIHIHLGHSNPISKGNFIQPN